VNVWVAWNVLLVALGIGAIMFGYGYEKPEGYIIVAFGVFLVCWRVVRALRGAP
jgi:hypothetical protein